MKSFFKLILKLVGWKIVGLTEIPNKCVICVAPHTSNWDLPLGLVVYKSMGKTASFLMKKDWFFFPMNILFNILGGIPVDRSKKTSLTEQITQVFNERDQFQLAITPEATRKRNADWKKGFYYMALAANVPILVVAADYQKKEVDFKKIVMPTGDVDADMIIIKQCYDGVIARFPDQFTV